MLKEMWGEDSVSLRDLSASARERADIPFCLFDSTGARQSAATDRIPQLPDRQEMQAVDDDVAVSSSGSDANR